MTPEQIKAERQLTWMKGNLPPIPGESVNLQRKRREKLIKILSLLSADTNGCIYYKGGVSANPPNIDWPNRDKFEEDKRTQPIAARYFCVWPKAECKRRPAQKRHKNSKDPLYCELPDPVTGEIHNADRAAHYRRHVSDEEAKKRGFYRKTSKARPISRILMELYAPDVAKSADKITARCGNKNCVNLSHRIDLKLWNANKLKGKVLGFDRRFSRDQVREAVRLRLEEHCSLTDIEAKTGISTSSMSQILKRKIYVRYTDDLLEGVDLPKRCLSR